ncbi:hypothetical protein [Streptomyces sp. NPDC053427]|uniref:hypothetical protein n=1 Tax=Streptomyces sp. NPDC053427 TaxID=3365701 RepID=UPI0037D208AD
MRRIAQLLRPLAAATATGAAAPGHAPPASGFLTIGAITYIDPIGHYPIDHPPDGTPTLVINDTDHHVTVVTERDHVPRRGPTLTPITDIVLAPGSRTETRRGHSVQVGWGRVMGG